MSETSKDRRAGRIDQLSLFGDAETILTEPPAGVPLDADAAARRFAIDPFNNVVLEASAGTGKTSVLVSRYINLLRAGVDPANILAITFTRKAAAEMRERIVRELRDAAARSELERRRWHDLGDRLNDIAISTIDAFCLSLLREFPLEADLDPGFGMADETEIPRLAGEALDRALRILTARARTDADVALVLAQLGLSRAREGLATLLDRRLVAGEALDRFLERGPADLTPEVACRRAATCVLDLLRAVPRGLPAFTADGPVAHPRFHLFIKDVERLASVEAQTDAVLRGVLDRIAAHFLTLDGKARRTGAIPPYRQDDHPSPDAARRHRAAVFQIAPQIERAIQAFRRDLNVILARGIRRMFGISIDQYRRALEERSVLDFSDVLQRALALLRQMDEFAQSRFRLESRYHHVLVDEFQDTSRAQWELVSLLIQSWGEGLGLATQPSIFIVGDRKQSIYRFRDAEVAVLQQAGQYIETLRPGRSSRRTISRSFRAVPELLAFVNDVFAEIGSDAPVRPDDFTFQESDRFPVDPAPRSLRGPVLGIAAADDPEICAASVALEIERLLRDATVRDKQTGVPRQATPGDIGILFRSRASHREFEGALERRGIPAYVYKGLGFFDADETKDVTALIRYLANPASHLRAAAFLRSRFVRISDRALATLAPDLAGALGAAEPPADVPDDDRRVLLCVRKHVQTWLTQVDRVPPAELIEGILEEAAYAWELGGPRRDQAWENLKKIRGLVRRIQNRGYSTFARIADHLDALSAGDESNAIIEALDAVNLMTVHAAKGLEFPIVFVVNMAKGASGIPKPVRVIVNGDEPPSVSVGPFVSEADETERLRERNETRRLLYVAMTRARDRLYLSSALKDGAVVAGRGSLAEVLPASVAQLFVHAATAFPEYETVAWTSPAGNTFELRVCRPPVAEASSAANVASREGLPKPALLNTAPAAGILRRTVTDQLATGATGGDSLHPARGAAFGRLLHGLIRVSARLDRAASDERLEIARMLLAGDRDSIDFSPSTLEDAVDAWCRLRSRSELSGFWESADRYHEIPFSMREGNSIVRGAIDCMIRQPSGRLLVLEFKTGAPVPVDQIQLDTYVRAARSIFPDSIVEGKLVYL